MYNSIQEYWMKNIDNSIKLDYNTDTIIIFRKRKEETFLNTVIKNTEAIIREKGLKKKSVAEKAGYSKQQFSNLLNGRKF